MSEHQQKKKRKAQRTAMKSKQSSLEENRFLLICAVGLLVIFLSTSLPGKAGLYVQSAIVGLIIFGCIVRNVRKSEPEKVDEVAEEKEEKTDEETT